ncbi:MAG: hypothetical protein WA799_03265 [Nitrosotalea sp.]
MSEEEKKEVDEEEDEDLQLFLYVMKTMIKRNFTIGIKMASLPMRMASG